MLRTVGCVCCFVWFALALSLYAAEKNQSRIPPKVTQGIRGQVVKLVGDFTMDPPTGQRVPISVPVHVFRRRIQPFEKPNSQHPALVKVLHSDKEGKFEIELPPGEYTVVIELSGKLYLNNWMEDGCWAVTVVKAGAWTQCTIEDVLEAMF
ncbi:MAG: hypothetical protein ACUVWX_08505 [Kiritimatiellia bacterium]